jgi:hypothetical protein
MSLSCFLESIYDIFNDEVSAADVVFIRINEEEEFLIFLRVISGTFLEENPSGYPHISQKCYQRANVFDAVCDGNFHK